MGGKSLGRGGGKSGGGLLTAIKDGLNPVLIDTENNKSEILIVQIKAMNYDIRVINAYGPRDSNNAYYSND